MKLEPPLVPTLTRLAAAGGMAAWVLRTVRRSLVPPASQEPVERRSGRERRSGVDRRRGAPTSGVVARVHAATGSRSGRERRSGIDRRGAAVGAPRAVEG